MLGVAALQGLEAGSARRRPWREPGMAHEFLVDWAPWVLTRISLGRPRTSGVRQGSAEGDACEQEDEQEHVEGRGQEAGGCIRRGSPIRDGAHVA